jgi:protein transport protein SEC24
MSDYGSIKRLNWKDPVLPEHMQKSQSHAERTEVHHRYGTPPTRRGPSFFQPNPYVPELNPPLYLSKNLGGMQVPLKPQAPQMPGQMPPGGQVPGMGSQAGGQSQVPNQQPIGMSNSGMPIYPDPFHPAHKDFGKDDHEAAAAQHEKLAAGSGNPQEMSQHLQASAAHKQMGADSQSPMERFAGKFGQQQGGMNVPMQGQPAGGRTPMPGMPGQQPGQQPGMQGQHPGMPPGQQPGMQHGQPPGMPGQQPGMMGQRPPMGMPGQQPGMPPQPGMSPGGGAQPQQPGMPPQPGMSPGGGAQPQQPGLVKPPAPPMGGGMPGFGQPPQGSWWYAGNGPTSAASTATTNGRCSGTATRNAGTDARNDGGWPAAACS